MHYSVHKTVGYAQELNYNKLAYNNKLLSQTFLERFFEMIHENNDQGHHHPSCEGEHIPEAVALAGGGGLGAWPTVDYTISESLHLVLQGTHSSL